MEPTIDHRKHQRHHVNLPGVYSANSVQVKEAIVLDLSIGGCRVASTIPMSPDSAIQLQIRPQQVVPISIPSAIVRWASGYTFGVQFSELPEHESSALTRLLWSLPASGRDSSSSPSSEV